MLPTSIYYSPIGDIRNKYNADDMASGFSNKAVEKLGKWAEGNKLTINNSKTRIRKDGRPAVSQETGIKFFHTLVSR